MQMLLAIITLGPELATILPAVRKRYGLVSEVVYVEVVQLLSLGSAQLHGHVRTGRDLSALRALRPAVDGMGRRSAR
jgi:hypothetical protein